MSSPNSQPTESAAAVRSKDWHFLLQLFRETLRISTFTIGGGFIIITFLQERFVEKLHWLSEDEMVNLVAIAQSSPGPVAINTAVLAGYKLAGLAGAFFAVLGTTLPPLTIITAIAYCYHWIADSRSLQAFFYGARYAEAALIANVTINMAKMIFKTSGLPGLTLGLIAAFIIMTAADSVIYIVAAFATVGLIFFRHSTPPNKQTETAQ
ncbi:MAG: chromate transporter [Candidatus Bruticola sp.]